MSLIYWTGILFSGLISAIIASVLTHWIETRKEKKATRDRLLSYLCLVEIDLSINSEMANSDNTLYMVNGLRTFLRSDVIREVNKELVGTFIKLLTVMEHFNKGIEPFQKISSETSRINKLHAQSVATANKLLNISASCIKEIPQKLKPTIDKTSELLRNEVAKHSKLAGSLMQKIRCPCVCGFGTNHQLEDE